VTNQDDDQDKDAAAWLASLSPQQQALVRRVLANHPGLTLATALRALTEAGM
jgi:hypothetical protein